MASRTQPVRRVNVLPIKRAVCVASSIRRLQYTLPINQTVAGACGTALRIHTERRHICYAKRTKRNSRDGEDFDDDWLDEQDEERAAGRKRGFDDDEEEEEVDLDLFVDEEDPPLKGMRALARGGFEGEEELEDMLPDEEMGLDSMLELENEGDEAAAEQAATASQASAAAAAEGEDVDPNTKYPPLPFRMFTLDRMLIEAGVLDQEDEAGIAATADIVISGVTNSPFEIKPGNVFLCFQNEFFDGHDWVDVALNHGAACVVATRDLPAVDGMVLVVDDIMAAAHTFASIFYEVPSTKLLTVGVAGSAGKTTVSWLIRGVLEETEKYRLTGMIGSVEYALADDLLTAEGDFWVRTEEDPTLNRECSAPFHVTPYQGKYNVLESTPDGIQLQRIMAGMVDRGAQACVIECSASGLAEGRCDYTQFDIAVMTNICEDMMEAEGFDDIDEYKDATGRLFELLHDGRTQCAVLNADDPYFEFFKEKAEGQVPVVTYGIKNETADVRLVRMKLSIWESELLIEIPGPPGRPGIQLQIITPLIGRQNVYNVLAAVAAAISMKIEDPQNPDRPRPIPLQAIVAGIEAVEVVPGRTELIDEGQEFSVVVDAASTPQSLDRLLDSMRECGAKRIITVVGCKGNEDRKDRPYIGEIVHYKSDVVILTNDNPRTEAPEDIIADIVAGYPTEVSEPLPGAPVDHMQDISRLPLCLEQEIYDDHMRKVKRYVMEDRFSAIRAAIGTAAKGDVVVVAGKGHEDFMDYGDGEGGIVRGWFDDRVECRNALSKLPYLEQIPMLSRKELPWS